MNNRILIVEDEAKLREVLSDYFRSKGETPVEAADGVEALALLEEQDFDAVLLDIMMPGLNGLSVCRAVRKDNDVPIIFLTALSDEEDKLHCGRGWAGGGIPFFVGGGGVYAEGKELTLTPKEYALLCCLMQNKSLVMSREQLLVKCWGYDYEGEARAVDTHIKRLREKLGGCAGCIQTVIKAGYRLEG